mmetsp:Transcript_10976/g.13881  ORF Transcript_10976/g.13881 Transcript_10976/m.13881 type:complete len:93 (+) Transcript_10976:351-629(+)
MAAWAGTLGIEDSMITMLADPAGSLTQALAMEIKSPVPADLFGIIGRGKRFAMHCVDGKIMSTAISYSDTDPFGADDPSATNPSALVEMIKK